MGDVLPLHEPWLVWSPAFRRLERLGPAEAGTPSCQRFMVPMRGFKVVEALHEPLFRSAGCQPAVSPIANRRGVGTSNGQRVGNPRYSAARPSRNQNKLTTDEHG